MWKCGFFIFVFFWWWIMDHQTEVLKRYPFHPFFTADGFTPQTTRIFSVSFQICLVCAEEIRETTLITFYIVIYKTLNPFITIIYPFSTECDPFLFRFCAENMKMKELWETFYVCLIKYCGNFVCVTRMCFWIHVIFHVSPSLNDFFA